MARSTAKDIIKLAEELGFYYKVTKTNRLQFMHPNCPGIVLVAPHSGDPRAMLNAETMLRRKLREAPQPQPPKENYHGIR